MSAFRLADVRTWTRLCAHVLVACLCGACNTSNGRTELIVTVNSSVGVYDRVDLVVFIDGERTPVADAPFNDGEPIEVPFSFTLTPARDPMTPRTVRLIGRLEDRAHVGELGNLRFQNGERGNLSITLTGEPGLDGGVDAGDAGCVVGETLCVDNATLGTCGEDGAFVLIDCPSDSPVCFGNSGSTRCGECDPREEPFCQENLLVSCDANGERREQRCLSACDAAASPPSCGSSCADGATECNGPLLRVCRDGAWVEQACDVGCREFPTSGAACEQFTPSNLPSDFVPDLRATGVLSREALYGVDDRRKFISIDGATGEISVRDLSTPDSRIVVRPRGTIHEGIHYRVEDEVAIFTMRRMHVRPDEAVLVSGDRPVILVATESVEVLGWLYAGAIQLSASVSVPGPGGAAGGALMSSTGQGPGGGSGGRDLEGSMRDGGGAGGSYGSVGGDGGTPGGSAAEPYGNAMLIPLVGGSGGGVGGDNDGGRGGASGGALQISAYQTLIVRLAGRIMASGSGGAAGIRGMVDGGGGGGGGSGGALLLEAVDVTIRGTVGVPGGGGGAGWQCMGGSAPGCGPSVMSEPGGTWSDPANPMFASAAGGSGSGAGGSGGDGHADAPATDGFDAVNGGGGGGGAGRVRINGRTRVLEGTFLPDDSRIVTEGDIQTVPES